MNKKLEVKNLRVSFRTANGKVQAVRDISFDLYENETLAIVGESGSGKSVTTRAIMGISAFNAVLEGGEILYEGSDLLKYTEEDFQQLRGNKIAMIFQDPMSSLNPIVKVGKQLTEAMLLKNRIERKSAAKAFDRLLKKLTEFAGEERSEFLRLSGDFRRASAAGTRLEAKHTQARKNAASSADIHTSAPVSARSCATAPQWSKCAWLTKILPMRRGSNPSRQTASIRRCKLSAGPASTSTSSAPVSTRYAPTQRCPDT